MKIFQSLILIALFAVVLPAHAEWDSEVWPMGENEGGEDGGLLNGGTNAIFGSPRLTSQGSPRYSTDTPPTTTSLLSIEFDGATDRLFGSVQEILDVNFALSLWVRSDGLTTGNALLAYNGDPTGPGWGLLRIGSHWGFGYGEVQIASDAAVTDQWTRLVLVQADDEVLFYVNGQLAATTNRQAIIPEGMFEIGGSQFDPNLSFGGRIDMVVLSSFSAGEFDPDIVNKTRNFSSLYWVADQPGWGVHVSEQGPQVYALLFTYAADGLPMFLSLQTESFSADPFTGGYKGALYRIAGTPFQSIDGQPAYTAATRLGRASLSRLSDNRLHIGYTIDGVLQQHTLVRYEHDVAVPECERWAGPMPEAINYSDLWWRESEPGWGVSLSHQGDHIVLIWYTYGAAGRDQWFIGSRLELQPDGSFSGELQQPESGTPLMEVSGPATTFPVPTVGSASLRFIDGENAEFSYALNGVSQTKAITRFVLPGGENFRSLCSVPED